MAANELQRAHIADLKLALVEANQDCAADRRRTRRIPGALHLDGGVVLHRARAFLEVAEALQGQRLEVRAFLLKHLFDLALGPSVDAQRSPLLLMAKMRPLLKGNGELTEIP